MRLVAILAAVLIVTGAAVALDGDDSRTRPPAVALGDARLVSVESCGELLEWYQESARAVDAVALGGHGPMMAVEDVAVAGTAGGAAPAGARSNVGMAESDEAAPTTAATGGGDGFSGTNLQEVDVDEPDTVKTDGEVIVQATYAGVHVVDITGEEPRLVATVDLEDGTTELLLDGDRVLALTNVWRERETERAAAGGGDDRIGIMPVYGEPAVVVTALDIADPAEPAVVATTEIDGTYRSARVVGDTVRLVLTASPQLPPPDPALYENADARTVERRVEEWKDEAIESMTLEQWMPSVDGERGVACDSVVHPPEPAGFATTTVLTLDLHGDLEHLDEDAVVADAGTVYASTDRLYVATSQWAQTFSPQGGRPSTELHAFDITDPTSTAYVASGRVPGFLLNQFSLSERDGFLRVATTQQPPWDPAQEEQATSSSMAVLAEEGGELVEVGRLDGLGPTETIQAVRFVDDVAYVVTFRRTDPLFVIDLADPTDPVVAGELKIPGYSAYLHPIDDGRMIGVGQDADDEGRALGTQVSTFDVRDAASPTRIDNLTVEHASSMVEYDHRAFLWWGDTRTAVIPLEIYPELTAVPVDCPPGADCAPPGPGPEVRPFLGAAAFSVDGDGDVREIGRVSHDGRGGRSDGWYQVTRSIVAGDALYTISEAGILRSDLTTLADEGFAALPVPPQ